MRSGNHRWVVLTNSLFSSLAIRLLFYVGRYPTHRFHRKQSVSQTDHSRIKMSKQAISVFLIARQHIILSISKFGK